MKPNLAPVLTHNEKQQAHDAEENKMENNVGAMLKNPGYEAPLTTMHDALELIATYHVDNKKGDTPTDRLQIVWQKLGFTPQQKLSLLVKYTSNTDESFKLHDSYQHWEQCLTFANQYHNAYKSIKDFLMYEYGGFSHQATILKSLLKNMNLAEENLLDAEKHLREEYGDDLIVHRKRASDLVLQRREKISSILQKFQVHDLSLL